MRSTDTRHFRIQEGNTMDSMLSTEIIRKDDDNLIIVEEGDDLSRIVWLAWEQEKK
jgi:hypothetical protein